MNWAPLVLGIVLFATGLASGFALQHEQSMSALDGDLSARAARAASDVQAHLDQVRAVSLALSANATLDVGLDRDAQDRRFKFGDVNRGEPLERALQDVVQALPDVLSAISVVDADGRGVARVGAEGPLPGAGVADDGWLQAAEDLPPGAVWQSSPRPTADTQQWVIGTTTALRDTDGDLVGWIHLESGLDLIREQMAEHAVHTIRIVRVSDGAVVVDSRRPILPGPSLPSADDATFTAMSDATWHLTDTVSHDGLRMAISSIPQPTDGVVDDRWAAVVTATPPATPGIALGSQQALLLVMGLALLGIGILRFRGYARGLQTAASVDPLTGLHNRAAIMAEIDRTASVGQSMATLMIDLDRFKQVNDTLGHAAGDELLTEVATRLRGCLRDTDVIARLGGDEFAVLLTPLAVGDARAVEVADRIIEAIQEPVVLSAGPVSVSASVGVACSAAGDLDADQMLRRADLAMYEAKTNRLGVTRYRADLERDSPRRLTLTTDLRAAIADGAIQTHLQPQVDLHTGAVVGLEALARWIHPQHGFISPGEFIPLAEDVGLITPLTEVMLRQSLSTLAEVHRRGHTEIVVAVNMSVRSLMDPTFPDMVTRVLRASGLAPTVLQLELTEGLLMGEDTTEVQALRTLSQLGISIALDDFGTGHSSLSYLSRLPVDELKVDKSFVIGLADDPANEIILRSAVDLGHHLGLRVVAEGVEGQFHMDAVTAVGCDRAQGWHFGRPIPAGEVVDWLGDADARDAASA